MNYKLVKHLSGYAGDARVYLGEKGDCVMVSRASTVDRGDETMIFSWSNVHQKVSDWTELYAGYGESHEEALGNYASSL